MALLLTAAVIETVEETPSAAIARLVTVPVDAIEFVATIVVAPNNATLASIVKIVWLSTEQTPRLISVPA